MVRCYVGDDGVCYVIFEYEVNQGEFVLVLLEEWVYMLDIDIIVELIVVYIVDKFKVDYFIDIIWVKVFEGVGKGVIVLC